MKIYMSGYNAAGVISSLCEAINNHTRHTARYWTEPNFLEYPSDLKKEEIGKYISESDVIHWHGRGNPPFKTGAINIRHYHGTDIRAPTPYAPPFTTIQQSQQPKRKHHLIFVSTPDLLWYVPEANYLPNPIDVDSFKKVDQHTESPVVCQSYADPNLVSIDQYEKNIGKIAPFYQTLVGKDETIKHTKFFRNVIKGTIISGVPWTRCVEMKLKCHILFDQIYLGAYGQSAIESMAMGQPVLARIPFETSKHYGKHPVVNIDETTILEELDCLIEDENYRKKVANESIKYVKMIHDYPVIANRYIEMIEEVG